MPKTRRKQNTASTRNQSTLSFKNKSARITKPSLQDTSAANKKAQSKLSEPQEIEIEEASPAAQTTDIEASAQPAAKDQDEVEQGQEQEQEQEISIPVHPTPQKKKHKKAPAKSSRETAADKITDAQIKKYWKAEEDARLAPRVHQSSTPLHEKILRHFDLSSQYGPCIGLTRLSRWRRADTLGLNPPVEVLAVLMREENDRTSQGCGKIAYIDELGGGRVGIWE